MLPLQLAALVIVCVTRCLAQGTYSCLSGNQNVASDLPNCDYLTSAYTNCNTLTDRAALNSCVCTPQIFSAIFNCESETRECLKSYEEDNQAQNVLSNWHLQCDAFTTSPFSTPSLLAPQSTIANTAICASIASVCYTGGSSLKDCVTMYPATTGTGYSSFLKCACIPQLITAASVCEYDGNTTCSNKPAAVTNIALWSFCGVTAAPASNTATTTLVGPSSSSGTSLSSSVPVPTTSSGPSTQTTTAVVTSSASLSSQKSSAAASTSSNAGSRAKQPMEYAFSVIGLGAVAFWIL